MLYLYQNMYNRSISFKVFFKATSYIINTNIDKQNSTNKILLIIVPYVDIIGLCHSGVNL